MNMDIRILTAALIIVITTIIELFALRYQSTIEKNEMLKLVISLVIAMDVMVLLQLLSSII